jgi:hypothetical protein
MCSAMWSNPAATMLHHHQLPIHETLLSCNKSQTTDTHNTRSS